MTDHVERLKLEQREGWDKYVHSMPPLHFDPEWDVRIIPPTGGAFVRFTIDYNGKWMSVYLDCLSRLGCMEEPYWEAYDRASGDTNRFYFLETNELMQYVRSVLTGKDTNA